MAKYVTWWQVGEKCVSIEYPLEILRIFEDKDGLLTKIHVLIQLHTNDMYF